MFFEPGGVHVGHTLETGEVLVAYGWWDDDAGLQAAITLLPPPQKRGPVWDEGGLADAPQNYRTFLIDRGGERIDVTEHSNIVYAVKRYVDEFGMDV